MTELYNFYIPNTQRYRSLINEMRFGDRTVFATSTGYLIAKSRSVKSTHTEITVESNMNMAHVTVKTYEKDIEFAKTIAIQVLNSIWQDAETFFSHSYPTCLIQNEKGWIYYQSIKSAKQFQSVIGAASHIRIDPETGFITAVDGNGVKSRYTLFGVFPGIEDFYKDTPKESIECQEDKLWQYKATFKIGGILKGHVINIEDLKIIRDKLDQRVGIFGEYGRVVKKFNKVDDTRTALCFDSYRWEEKEGKLILLGQAYGPLGSELLNAKDGSYGFTVRFVEGGGIISIIAIDAVPNI